jgi:hypothetical protein
LPQPPQEDPPQPLSQPPQDEPQLSQQLDWQHIRLAHSRSHRLGRQQLLQQVVGQHDSQQGVGAGWQQFSTGTLRHTFTHTSSGTHSFTWRHTFTGTISVTW